MKNAPIINTTQRPSLFRRILRRLITESSIALAKFRVNFLWSVMPRKGTTDKNYGRELIVSLTSFPARINTVHKTIQSLLLQSMKPNRIILWLAEDEFPGKDSELPEQLLRLKKYGLEIIYCENLRSFKKLIPALRAFPGADIVTADDDLYYRRNWLKTLYAEHMRHPEDICAHRITKFYIDESGEFRTIAGGYDVYPCPSYLNKLSGGAGTLYMPGILHPDVTQKELFMTLCPTSDDIWFWLMGVLNHMRVRVTKGNYFHLALAYVEGTQEGPTLAKINDQGEKLFWKDFGRILKHYPELNQILRDEYERMKKI